MQIDSFVREGSTLGKYPGASTIQSEMNFCTRTITGGKAKYIVHPVFAMPIVLCDSVKSRVF